MSNLETKVRDCIEQLVKTRTEFTAYDITKELRQLYPGVDIPHAGGVRECVHGSFEKSHPVFAGYDRELNYSLGISPAPWRYFFDWDYPQTPDTLKALLNQAPSAPPQDTRPLCPTCARPMHKKGFGLYQVQRYRCLTCRAQANEFTGSVFHNRKHRPATILDALWCIAHGRTNTYTANAVDAHPRTVSTWRRITKETWVVTSPIIASLDRRFDNTTLDKLQAAL